MFDSIDPRGDTWRSYTLHCFLGLVLTPVVGLADDRLTPLAGAMIPWTTARWAASRAAAYVWAPAVVLFLFARLIQYGVGVRRGREYFTNTRFGPNCHESECLYTMFTAVLTGAAAYSLAGWTMWRRRSRRTVSG